MNEATRRTNTETAAYRASMGRFQDVVNGLVGIIGKKLTLYIAGKRDTRTLESWLKGGTTDQTQVDARLRLAYRIAKTIVDAGDAPITVQAWFINLNPELHDRVPAKLLREGQPEKEGAEVLDAARAYVTGG